MELKRLRNDMVHPLPAGGPEKPVVMLADLEALRPGDESQTKGSRRPQLHSDSQAAVNPRFLHVFVFLRLSLGRIGPIHTGESLQTEMLIFWKHPETAFNQPSGPAVAWLNWHMKSVITLADEEPGCLVPWDSDASPEGTSCPEWQSQGCEPGSESTRLVMESRHLCSERSEAQTQGAWGQGTENQRWIYQITLH